MRNNKRGKITSASFALMLIISTFAFAYMIGSEVKEVSAIIILNENAIPSGQRGLFVYKGQEFVLDGRQYTATSTFLYRPGGETTADSLIYTGVASLNQRTQASSTEGTQQATVMPSPAVSVTTTSQQITAGLAIDEYKIQPLTVSVGDKNVQVTKVYNDGSLYTLVGTNRVELNDALVSSGYLTKDGIIDPSKYEYKTGQVLYSIDRDGKAMQYRTKTYTGVAGKEETIIETSPGNNDWSEVEKDSKGNYALPDGYSYDANTKSFTGGLGEVLSVKGEYSYIKIGDTVYKQGSDSTLQKIEYSNGLPTGSIPTTFDAAGNPTQWTTQAGAIYNNKGEFIGRGEVKAFGTEWNFGTGHILQGVQWAGIAAGLTLTIGQLFIKDQKNLMAMTAGIAAGIMVGKTAYAILGKGGNFFGASGFTEKPGMISNQFDAKTSWLGSPYTSAAIGAATAWLVYNAMWSKETSSVETVTFNCLPWQAPNGGKDCELCNDADLPCSEYRCKSLGQSCEIVNKGTKEERCVNVNPQDSSPPIIKPNNADISEGYEYFDIVEMPPGAGFKIKSKTTSTGCIPAYTAIQFGITTNEPSQCKIDIAPQGNYSKMATYLNGDNLYKYNHTEILNLPSSADLKNSSITLKNGKELTFYMRCRDAAGNANEADYALTVCVDPSPDNTAPLVQGTSIENKGCVPADSENATVQFYINEPSECKWDYYDKDFEQMNNNMSCSTSAIEINAIQSYTCTTLLKGVGRDGNNFYVRCKDQPEGINESKRNTNKESYVFNLRRSNQLKLKIVKPNETIYGVVRPTPVELYAETLFGCEDNKAICYYSATGAANSFVQFFDTDKSDGIHTQRLDLNDGAYTYYIRCVDSGGNVVNTTTTFRVNIDTNAPVVARAYEEEGYLKIVTPLNSECVYNSESCDYLFNEGTSMPYANSTVHVTQWFSDKKYFIKCRDEYRSEPVDCSLIVRPTDNFLGA